MIFFLKRIMVFVTVSYHRHNHTTMVKHMMLARMPIQKKKQNIRETIWTDRMKTYELDEKRLSKRLNFMLTLDLFQRKLIKFNGIKSFVPKNYLGKKNIL